MIKLKDVQERVAKNKKVWCGPDQVRMVTQLFLEDLAKQCGRNGLEGSLDVLSMIRRTHTKMARKKVTRGAKPKEASPKVNEG